MHPPEVEKPRRNNQGRIAWKKTNKVWERSACSSERAARQIRGVLCQCHGEDACTCGAFWKDSCRIGCLCSTRFEFFALPTVAAGAGEPPGDVVGDSIEALFRQRLVGEAEDAVMFLQLMLDANLSIAGESGHARRSLVVVVAA